MVKLLKNIIKLITHRIFLIPLLMIAQIALIFLIVLDYKEYIVHFYLISSVISILMTLYIICIKISTIISKMFYYQLM